MWIVSIFINDLYNTCKRMDGRMLSMTKAPSWAFLQGIAQYCGGNNGAGIQIMPEQYCMQYCSGGIPAGRGSGIHGKERPFGFFKPHGQKGNADGIGCFALSLSTLLVGNDTAGRELWACYF